ncbi:hypothetical protein GQ43DRAFT_403245, partial [Delitschia confertaspora ATCC 74209]
MTRYEYPPLCRSKNEIRLLILLPNNGNGALKNVPSCKIFRADLPRKPKFIALSYVWGDPNEQRTILLGNYPVRVTRNLYEAMMTLRSSKEHIVIWIDSLCINQSDNEEKSWQVELMANIYKDASKVIAWLGPADESSDATMDYLNDFGQRAEACCTLDLGPEIYRRAWQDFPLKSP